jgi:glucan phosphoethanolaminetransferase (alkaline phosphatase superfamily)
MESKFKIVSYFILLFLFFSTGLLIKILFDFATTFNSKFAGSLVVLLLLFVVLIIFIELKDKIIAIKFEQNGIKINRFCGIKNPIFINNKEIDGFHNSIVTTRNGSYNYAYLMKGNKKIAKISEQYHKNFKELFSEIEKKYKNLGFINSNFISELKDMF